MSGTTKPPVQALPQDSVGLSYTLTGFTALAALATLMAIGTQLVLSCHRATKMLGRVLPLLSSPCLGYVSTSVSVLVSCLALLILMVSGEAGPPANSLCLKGGALLLLGIHSRLWNDCILAGVECVRAWRGKVRMPLYASALIFTWPVAAMAVFLPSLFRIESSPPFSCVPVFPRAWSGHSHSAALVAVSWLLFAVTASFELARAVRRRRTGGSGGTWGVHPALLICQLLLLTPLSAMTAQPHSGGDVDTRITLRWLLLYLALAHCLLHSLLLAISVHRQWVSVDASPPVTLLNCDDIPARLCHIQGAETAIRVAGVSSFRISWSARGRTQTGFLRVFAPFARHRWNEESMAARLLADRPHSNICRFLWTGSHTPFHAALACVAADTVTESWRIVCRTNYERGSLADLLRDNVHCLSEGFVHHIGMDLARALVHLRNLSILHGCVCPEMVNLQGFGDGSVRAVLCDFHLSSRLPDLSLCVDGCADTSLVYSLSSRSGFMDALRDNQFAGDIRALSLLLLHLLLGVVDRGQSLSLARASVSPSLERVAEEEDEAGAADGGRDGVYEPLGPLARGSSPSSKKLHFFPPRRAPKTAFDNVAYEASSDRSAPQESAHCYENLPSSSEAAPGPPTPHSAHSADSLSTGATLPANGGHPDLVRTAVEQRRMHRLRRTQPSPSAGLPLTPATSTSLSLLETSSSEPSGRQLTGHEAEYCLRVAREHPKWIDVGAMLHRDLVHVRSTVRAMRAVLSNFGGDMVETAMFAWLSDPCLSAENFLVSLKDIMPHSAV